MAKNIYIKVGQSLVAMYSNSGVSVVLLAVLILLPGIVSAASSCGYCHGTGESASTHIDFSSFSKGVHSDINRDGRTNESDCTTCHYDLSNMYNRSVPTYSCKDCHVEQKVQSPEVSEHYQGGGEVSTSAECEKCHLNSLVPASEDDNYTPPEANASHYSRYGGLIATKNCPSCHYNSSLGQKWGNATRVSEETMYGSSSQEECAVCHGEVKNFHQNPTSRFASDPDMGGQSCRDCHFKLSGELQIEKKAFSESTHGSKSCVLCHPADEMLNLYRVDGRECGSGGDCHGSTPYTNESSGLSEHSQKEVPCSGCHGSYHSVGKFEDVCVTCHKFNNTAVYMISGIEELPENGKLRCTFCHRQWHEEDITLPSCTDCHDKMQEMQATGRSCENCHGSLHDLHSREENITCTNCHTMYHNEPRNVQCQSCHGMAPRPGEVEIPLTHANCSTCHTHFTTPEVPGKCMECHGGGDIHPSGMVGDFHSGKNISCKKCHTRGTEEKPDCTLCHNQHYIHEDKSCKQCHGNNRTHYGFGCSTCHKLSVENGTVPPTGVSDITRPEGCQECHSYINHDTCSTCHDAARGINLGTAQSTPFNLTGLYGSSRDRKILVKAKVDKTIPLSNYSKLTPSPAFNTVKLSRQPGEEDIEPLPFSLHERPRLYALPMLNIEGLEKGKIIKRLEKGDYIVAKREYPEVVLKPYISRNLSPVPEMKREWAMKFTDSVYMLVQSTTSASEGRLTVFCNNDNYGSLNLKGVAEGEITSALSDIPCLYPYDIFLVDSAPDSVQIALVNRKNRITLEDEQKDALGYQKVELNRNMTRLVLKGKEKYFREMEYMPGEDIIDRYVVAGGPFSNNLSRELNTRLGIEFGKVRGGIRLSFMENTLTFKDSMWGREDYAVAAVVRDGENRAYYLAEGCTRFGTRAAVNFLLESKIPSERSLALLHWKDGNLNGKIEHKEIEILYAH